jgi:hypothetical protein
MQRVRQLDDQGLVAVLISTSFPENLTTFPIAPLKPSGFFGGTISSAELDLLSVAAAKCVLDSFEVQAVAREMARTAHNHALPD